jgi:hypothetical protein
MALTGEVPNQPAAGEGDIIQMRGNKNGMLCVHLSIVSKIPRDSTEIFELWYACRKTLFSLDNPSPTQ